MAFVLQQLINALALGSIYALMAIGLAIIFGILRLINFAHGELLMIGPYLVLVLSLLGLPFGAAVPHSSSRSCCSTCCGRSRDWRARRSANCSRRPPDTSTT